MTLDQLRDVSDRAIVPFVSVATKLGLSPNAISTLALIVAIAAGIALALAGENTQLYFIAGLLVLFNGFLDVLDGAVARETNTTSEAGDYLDHLIDRYADVLILGGLTVGAQQYELGLLAITGVLLTAYLGTQAQAVGLGRMYGGLLGRADILMLVGIVALLAPWVTRELYGLTIVGLLLAFFAVVSHITALQRFVWSWKQLRKLDE